MCPLVRKGVAAPLPRSEQGCFAGKSVIGWCTRPTWVVTWLDKAFSDVYYVVDARDMSRFDSGLEEIGPLSRGVTYNQAICPVTAEIFGRLFAESGGDASAMFAGWCVHDGGKADRGRLEQ